MEDFARALATVVRYLSHTLGWLEVRRIAVGGGMWASRVGELAIGRASVLLRAEGHAARLHPIRHHPDEAGLVGAAHLAPTSVLRWSNVLPAAHIGGSNTQAGLVELNLHRSPDLRATRVMGLDLWRHGDAAPGREAAVARLAEMLCRLARRARRKGVRLTPFVGIACPGIIGEDGSIKRGGQNLPGNREDDGFNLPRHLREALPRPGGRATEVLMHNDAVIQGLSERPWMTGASP